MILHLKIIKKVYIISPKDYLMTFNMPVWMCMCMCMPVCMKCAPAPPQGSTLHMLPTAHWPEFSVTIWVWRIICSENTKLQKCWKIVGDCQSLWTLLTEVRINYWFLVHTYSSFQILILTSCHLQFEDCVISFILQHFLFDAHVVSSVDGVAVFCGAELGADLMRGDASRVRTGYRKVAGTKTLRV